MGLLDLFWNTSQDSSLKMLEEAVVKNTELLKAQQSLLIVLQERVNFLDDQILSLKKRMLER